MGNPREMASEIDAASPCVSSHRPVLPETFFMKGTFDEARNCTPSPKNEEKILIISLTLDVKDALEEGKGDFREQRAKTMMTMNSMKMKIFSFCPGGE